MDNRELDVRVAEALGLEVVGEAYCWNPDGGGCTICDWLEDHIEGDYWGGGIRPVYVDHCVCEWMETDPINAERLEYQTKRFGHYKQCLGMVQFYSTDWGAAGPLLEHLRENGYDVYLVLYEDGALVIVFPREGTPDKMSTPIGGEHEAPTAPEAISRAFIEVMGKEE